MVFADTRCDQVWDIVFVGENCALFHMSRDDFYGLVGCKVVVRIDTLLLVFGKVFGTHRFSDVVVKCHNAHQEGVGSDTFGDMFGEVRNLDAVVEGSRSVFRDALECGTVKVRHFHERKHGRDAEYAFHQVDECHRGECVAQNDVCACRNQVLVESFERKSVTQQVHDADCRCGCDNAQDNAPHELHTVTHAGDGGSCCECNSECADHGG